MFVDFHNDWSLPERPEPKPTPPRNARAETIITWVVVFNLTMLLVGPLAGATVFDAVIALFRS